MTREEYKRLRAEHRARFEQRRRQAEKAFWDGARLGTFQASAYGSVVAMLVMLSTDHPGWALAFCVPGLLGWYGLRMESR